MTTARQEAWFGGALGRLMNLDGVYDYQCVDVPNDYANFIFGDWQRTIRRGDAKDKYTNAPADYWQKIPYSSGQRPERGDVIVWGPMPSIGNPAGHIGVVESATASNVTIFEQDGFLQIPTRRKTHPYRLNGALPIGWLRPRPEKMIGGSPMSDQELRTRADIAVLARAERNITPQELERFLKENKETGIEPHTWAQRNVPMNDLDKLRRAQFSDQVLQWRTAHDEPGEYEAWEASGQPMSYWIQYNIVNPAIDELEKKVKSLEAQLGDTPSPDSEKLKEMDAIIHR